MIAARRGIVPWLGALLTLAPVYWIAAMSAVLFYQDAAGRFLMAPMALAGATWGLVGRRRPVAWGLAGIAVTALALAVLNDSKRPSGASAARAARAARATGRRLAGARSGARCTSPT